MVAGLCRCLVSVRPSPRLEAVLAIYRFVVRWSERNHSFPSALRAYRGEHFTVGISAAALLILPCSPAPGATCGLIRKALFSIEVLFIRGEHEICPAVPASKCLVCQNRYTSNITEHSLLVNIKYTTHSLYSHRNLLRIRNNLATNDYHNSVPSAYIKAIRRAI